MEGSKLLDGLKDEMLEDIFCSMVCKIIKIHDDKKIDAKPLYKINGKSIPQLVQVPLMHLGNGNSIINVESKVGDYVLVVFSDYDIDNLIINGQEKEVNTLSKHDISDALAIPFSFTPFNQSKAQTSKIIMNKDGSIDIVSDGDLNITTTDNYDVNINCYDYNVTQRRTL